MYIYTHKYYVVQHVFNIYCKDFSENEYIQNLTYCQKVYKNSLITH